MMLFKKTKLFNTLLFLFFVSCTVSCATKKEPTTEQQIQTQLTVIDSLLRSEAFSLQIAKTQDTAYYKGIGQPVPPLSTPAGDTATITISAKDEKIATNLAGFYALECGLGVLCNQQNEKPTDWLQKIVDEKADSAGILLLIRFANATWKAGQPFRDLKSITQPAFRVASFLPQEELVKNYYQVRTAASKLLASMQPVMDSAVSGQMQKIRSLLQSPSYAFEMAAFMDSGPKQTAPPLIAAKKDSTTIRKRVKDQKIATHVAGFYALECGLNYLVTTKKILPSIILQSITDNSITAADKDLFSRFANATWKASQPFRGLNRIERETFTPFYFLNEADIEKDWVQIKAAAAKVLMVL
jgi:hypothetical protein